MDKMTWHSAVQACQQWGASLVEVKHVVEHRLMESSLKKENVFNSIWLGASDEGGEWRCHSTDHPLQYTAWAYGEPNKGGSAHCLIMLNDDSEKDWKAVDCGLKQNFMCLKSSKTTQTF